LLMAVRLKEDSNVVTPYTGPRNLDTERG